MKEVHMIRLWPRENRIGRAQFCKYAVLPIFLSALPQTSKFFTIFGSRYGLGLDDTRFLSAIAALPFLIWFFAIARKRLHDLNLSGWVAPGLFAASNFLSNKLTPYLICVAILLVVQGGGLLILLFAPGTTEDNSYGPPP